MTAADEEFHRRRRQAPLAAVRATSGLGFEHCPPPPATCLLSPRTAAVRGSLLPFPVNESPSSLTTSAGRRPAIRRPRPDTTSTAAGRLPGGRTWRPRRRAGPGARCSRPWRSVGRWTADGRWDCVRCGIVERLSTRRLVTSLSYDWNLLTWTWRPHAVNVFSSIMKVCKGRHRLKV